MQYEINPWPIYEFMKRTWNQTGKPPTRKEIDFRFRDCSEEERSEGMIEFLLAYEKTFKFCTPECEYENDFKDYFEQEKQGGDSA